MDGLLFILIGIFFIFSVYAFYPWISAKINPFLKEPTVATLEKTTDIIQTQIIEETKPPAVFEFFKRFVLYQLQPILQ